METRLIPPTRSFSGSPGPIRVPGGKVAMKTSKRSLVVWTATFGCVISLGGCGASPGGGGDGVTPPPPPPAATGEWSALGGGLLAPGDVTAIAVYNGDIIAAGDFVMAGGVAANRIARWDGTTWAALGDGVNGEVYTLTVYNDELIVGGEFDTAGGGTVYGIAGWQP